MFRQKSSASLALVLMMAALGRADIFRWDTGTVIPGTHGITPGIGMLLDHRNLAYAELTGFDLTDSNFEASNLANARLDRSTLTNVNLSSTILTNAHFRRSTLTNANLSQADLTNALLESATLTNADLRTANLTNADLNTSILLDAKLTGAIVNGADFRTTLNGGFTKEQLYSTQSYQDKNLTGIQLGNSVGDGWDFRDQNLANALFRPGLIRNSNFAGANLSNADMSSLQSGTFSSNTIYNQGTFFERFFDPVAKGLTFVPSVAGDFDANGRLDVTDILTFQSRYRGTLLQRWLPVSMFDLDGDLGVTKKDLTVWVKVLKNSYVGDANLDGAFDSTDLLEVFSAGKFNTTERNENGEIFNAANWSTGDWDTDGEFTTSDLIVALADGGYELGPRIVVATVPEAGNFIGLATGLCGFLWLRTHRLFR